MTTFTFRNNAGLLVTVTAEDESTARHLAMVELWGKPSGIYGNRYAGRGLVLQ